MQNEGGASWMFWNKRRYVIGFFISFGVFAAFIIRININVAIIKMTTNITIIGENETIYIGPEFDWDSKMRSIVLSSFFYGYISTQMLGGWLAARLGGKHVFGFGIGITAFLNLITPPAAKFSIYLLVIIRIVEGVFEGMTLPAINAIWANWAPPLERTKLSAFTLYGSVSATIFAMPVCSVMVERLGWPSVFYAFGAYGLIWFALWCIFIKDRPEDDPYISYSELIYIKTALRTVDCEKVLYPWKAILTSPPLWAILVAHIAENWGYVTMLTYLPEYMNDVLKFDIEKAGVLSALPYLLMFTLLTITCHTSDYLRKKNIFTTTCVRKFCSSFSFIGQAIFTASTVFILAPNVAVVCLVIAIGLGGIGCAGYIPNYLDVSPKHASVTFGIGNTLATLPGIISPMVTGYIVQNKTLEEWRIVFLTSSAIYLVGALVYGIFASGNLQPWANDHT